MNHVLEVDECLSNPCENSGICKDSLGAFTCTCATGYLGGYCETSRLTLFI